MITFNALNHTTVNYQLVKIDEYYGHAPLIAKSMLLAELDDHRQDGENHLVGLTIESESHNGLILIVEHKEDNWTIIDTWGPIMRKEEDLLMKEGEVKINRTVAGVMQHVYTVRLHDEPFED